MDVGARVWVADPTDEHVWLAARVLAVSSAPAAVSVELEAPDTRCSAATDEPETSADANNGSEASKGVPAAEAVSLRRQVALELTAAGDCSNVLPRNLPREQDQHDLVALPHLHEASILQALRLRYARHAIYTHIGEILISINPFQHLPQLYGPQVLRCYGLDAAVEHREPHLFAVARAAYADLVTNAHSQAILISGESGAGKTEATKIMMTYFALTCGRPPDDAASPQTASPVSMAKSTPAASPRMTIEAQVLQSNPILEAFGNARTVRNDNSSRFGKFIELRFQQRRRLAGARIRTYLLEKIRVIKQAAHERNFHIFYELLAACNSGDAAAVDAGISAAQRANWALQGGASSFRLLNQSACYERRDGVKDGAQFRQTRRAMQQLGLSAREIASVLEIVAAVLHMGNVDFEQKPQQQHDGAFADEARVRSSSANSPGDGHFERAATLLGVPTTDLEHALTKRWLHTSNETLVVGVDVAHACNTRNALTMECYRLLFEWLVARVNSKLRVDTANDTEGDTDTDTDTNSFIGLLDIFGFEDMAENSFEQLCINYANEALQHQFNQFIFEEEQRLYRDEGIRWNFVDFPNNRACLELFERRPIGLFSLTDQECVFPQGTDRALAAKYYLEFERKAAHPNFLSPPALQRASHFVVAHYAGRVTYTVDGFLAKNKDSFCESAAKLLAVSANPLIQELAAGSSTDAGVGDASAETEAGNGRHQHLRRAKSAISAVSVGSQFKLQLNELLTTVRATTPRYVRCIKPNDAHVGGRFQSVRVVEQLRSGGVLEAVRVARAGFPVRLSHGQFLARYRCVLLALHRTKDPQEDTEVSPLNQCLLQLTRLLLLAKDEASVSTETPEDEQTRQERCGVSLGKTRVFFRREPYEKLENLRAAVRLSASVELQRQARGLLARLAFRRLRQATIAMQVRVRARMAYRYVCWLRLIRQSSVLYWRLRQLCDRRRFLRARSGVLAVQCLLRCRLARAVVQRRRETHAATRIATLWRRWAAQHQYLQLCRAALALQCALRVRVARRELRARREESRNVIKLRQDNLQLKDELAALRRQLQALESTMDQERQTRVATVATATPAPTPTPQNRRASLLLSLPPLSPLPSKLENPALSVSSARKMTSLSIDTPECSNQSQHESELLESREGEEEDVLLDNGNPNAADGRDSSVVRRRFRGPELQLRSPARCNRRYSLPHVLTPADEDESAQQPPASPRARDRRHSLDLWHLQQAQAQEEARQLRDELRESARAEAAAAEPSPERQHLQALALQKLVASQIKTKTMQLQLQLPLPALKLQLDSDVAGPASARGHRRRSRTVDSPMASARPPAPLTACGPSKQRQGFSRWGFSTPHTMTHARSQGLPAYFDGDSGCSSGSAGRWDIPTRSASVGMQLRGRSPSNASSCWTPPSAAMRAGASLPRWSKAPHCKECDCEFGLLVRRHHCRQCGHSFCFEHSTRTLPLPALGYPTPQRVCDGCFEAHLQTMSTLRLPLLRRHPTEELTASSIASSSPRGLCEGDEDEDGLDDSDARYCALNSPEAVRIAPLPQLA